MHKFLPQFHGAMELAAESVDALARAAAKDIAIATGKELDKVMATMTKMKNDMPKVTQVTPHVLVLYGCETNTASLGDGCAGVCDV